jgi:hypothetical protein
MYDRPKLKLHCVVSIGDYCKWIFQNSYTVWSVYVKMYDRPKFQLHCVVSIGDYGKWIFQNSYTVWSVYVKMYDRPKFKLHCVVSIGDSGSGIFQNITWEIVFFFWFSAVQKARGEDPCQKCAEPKPYIKQQEKYHAGVTSVPVGRPRHWGRSYSTVRTSARKYGVKHR